MSVSEQGQVKGPAIGVSIVNYTTAGMVIDQMPALLTELEAAGGPFRIVVVDNASPNGDANVLRDAVAAMGRPEIEFVAAPRNGGFAYGNNVAFDALRRSGFTPDAVLLLNPDAEVRQGAIRALQAVLASEPKAGFVGARLENADGSTWSGALHFPSTLREFASGTKIDALLRRWPTLYEGEGRVFRCDWVCGAAILVRWAVVEDLGGMDDDYFLYYEEVDFMREARDRGWLTFHCSDSIVYHAHGASTGFALGVQGERRVPAYWYRSWNRYFVKAQGPVRARLTAVIKTIGMLIGLTQRRLRGKSRALAPHFIADFTRNSILSGNIDSAAPPPADNQGIAQGSAAAAQ